MAGDPGEELAKFRKGLADGVERNQLPLLRSATAIGLFAVGAAVAALALVAIGRSGHPVAGGGTPDAVPASFSPPPMSDIPPGPEGEAIKRGMAIFDDPGTHAAQFVGNSMACKNCHLDSGRRADSTPMWAAWVAYPQYRKKNNSLNTMEDRINGCFRYSMNAPNSPSGGPPPYGSDIYRDLEAYFRWLASGAPIAAKMKGGGYPTPPLSQAGYNPARGAKVFEAKCTACHGSDGQGARTPDGKVVYPPLWGPRSFNWGAGMARVDLAAGFIKANMPFDQPRTLSDQDAWDVAAFIDSHERPKDPRQTGSVADNAKANFSGQKSFYGATVAGKLLGTGVPGQR
jgi:thiosulfate dehydrogenase